MKALSNDLLTVRTFDELMPNDRAEENRLAQADERDRYAERGGVFGSEADAGDEPIGERAGTESEAA